ncbi:diguanylate cyclase [Deefgea tanakiae]|uniref:Diguanylate cyclase n=1 Tax=Deefgea tanakiae TaxID=2865840 RepID=A0ABX8Z7X2_9NEIS|nr:diguanylate cyclase [Deefgea tanakiae]QZA78687.1 diguanylate cyclase [Deefgea tanakiae]
MREDPLSPPDLGAEINHLRFTLDHVGAYVFTKDLEGRYTFANEMVCDLFGQHLDDVIGFTDEKFFDLTISDELRKNDLSVLKDGNHIEQVERNIIATTGEERIFWTVKRPICGADGKVTGLCGISTDITERLQLERDLEEQKKQLSQVLENMDAYVYIKDREGRYLYANENLARLYSKPVNEIVGTLEQDLLTPETSERLAAMDKAVFDGGCKVTGEEIVSDVNGKEIFCWSIKIPLFKDGKADRLIGISTDITDIILLKNKYQNLARIDTLTGVLTRGFLIEQAESILLRTQRREARLAVLLIDIDHFKAINDSYGHAFGDTYIISIVNACQKTLRESDIIGRFGGDEFIIVIDEADEDGLTIAAERFLASLRDSILTAPDGKKLKLSVSIGAALSDQSSTFEELMARADHALYQAKKAGRGCWRTAPSANS